MLSYKSIRSRITAYLMEHRQAGSDTVTMVHNQQQLAEYLGVTRPALSKEINKMAKENLIRLDTPKVHLLAPDLLQQFI
jgi:DNA-binding MarR family transcriptional regulator